MTKFKSLPLIGQSVLIYLLTIIISILFNPVFSKFYIKFYEPNFIGTGLFVDSKIEIFLGGFIAGYILLLSFLVFLLIDKKQWTVWGIGVITPVIMSLGNGNRYVFYSLLLSALGWGLAKGTLIIRKRISKQ